MNPIDLKNKINDIIKEEANLRKVESFIYEYSYSSGKSTISLKSYIGDIPFDISLVFSNIENIEKDIKIELEKHKNQKSIINEGQ
jgi:hypothetical protein